MMLLRKKICIPGTHVDGAATAPLALILWANLIKSSAETAFSSAFFIDASFFLASYTAEAYNYNSILLNSILKNKEQSCNPVIQYPTLMIND